MIPIPHLDLQEFRGFTKLELAGLQRVNLIVGRNNCGKTSLLEAIVLACQPMRVTQDLPGLLRAKPFNEAEQYRRWLVRDGAAKDSWIWRKPSKANHVRMAGPGHRIEAGKLADMQSHGSPVFQFAVPNAFQALECRILSVQLREPTSLVQLFDRAMSQRGGEERIETMLRQVDPRFRKIRIRAPNGQSPFIELDLGLSERLPLAQTGQGMSRLVALFSELLGDKPDVCVVDEIENGIHHTLLPQLWRGIATAARDLGVQVFATTHSHECIVAAHEAMAEQPSYDFSIVQLFRYEEQEPKGLQGRVLDRSLIEAAIKGEVDVR